jgi:phage tail protein X
MRYRTKDGDVLDAVCAKYYSGKPFRVEDVLAANPGLAARGPVLSAGVIIELPEFPDAAIETPAIRLWD